MVAVDQQYLATLKAKKRPLGTLVCLMCLGTGVVFPTRKDGQPDLRYSRPTQTCPDCKGRGY